MITNVHISISSLFAVEINGGVDMFEFTIVYIIITDH